MGDPAEVDDVDDLWSVDPDRFVPERTALARRLRAAGDRDGAAEVTALRKPPRSAWALNVTARRRPELVTRVLAAAEELRSAGGGDAFRTAMAASRDATEALVDGAARCPGADTDQWRSRMRDTVTAAASDAEVAEQLRTGTLRADHTPSDLGALAALDLPAGRPSGASSRARRAAVGSRRLTLVDDAPRRPATDRTERPDTAAREARARTRRLERQRRELERRSAEVERLRTEVAELEGGAARAAARADAAAAAVRDARLELDRAVSELADLQSGPGASDSA